MSGRSTEGGTHEFSTEAMTMEGGPRLKREQVLYRAMHSASAVCLQFAWKLIPIFLTIYQLLLLELHSLLEPARKRSVCTIESLRLRWYRGLKPIQQTMFAALSEDGR